MSYINQKNSQMWGWGSLPRHYAYQKERSITSWKDQSLPALHREWTSNAKTKAAFSYDRWFPEVGTNYQRPGS